MIRDAFILLPPIALTFTTILLWFFGWSAVIFASPISELYPGHSSRSIGIGITAIRGAAF